MITTVYIMLIFLMFPLYVEDRYSAMGFCKWRFYCYVTALYVALALIAALPELVRKVKDRRRPEIGICDLLVGAYGACVVITFLLAGDRHAVLLGAEGWYMGAATQLLLASSYFVTSRSPISVPWLVGCNAAGSGICFLIGILQRLGWDVLHLYEGMEVGYLSDYLSTIGNRTWMSGYACAVFPIGVYLFWQAEAKAGSGAEDKGQRLLWGAYSALAFMGLAATYSDSAYVGLAVVLFVLGVLSVGHDGKRVAFCKALCLWFGSSLFMCVLRALRGENVRDERRLSVYVYDWRYMLAGLLFCVALTALVRFGHSRGGNGTTASMSAAVRRRQRRYVALAGTCCVSIIAFVALNSGGVLERLFHVTLRNPYLYFNDDWGDSRGMIWRTLCRLYRELPLYRKLFGVGADGLAAHIYGSPEYARLFGAVWGDRIVTNAHNEWMNMFFCQGVVGGLVYIAVFAGGIIACLCGGSERTSPLVRAVGLCLLAYCFHNFFCYQQICATGPIFVLLGAAASLLRAERRAGESGAGTIAEGRAGGSGARTIAEK